jgi:S-adenosylmethionine hydrolase
MIVLFTDFGLSGPYEGQMRAVLLQETPAVPVVTLFADAPRFNPRASAYLLAAYADEFPSGTIFLGIIDPGVGTDRRLPVIVEADGRWYVGPGNGLFQIVQQRAKAARQWEVLWRPSRLTRSFHGRDLFAPVAAQIARGEWPPTRLLSTAEKWPDDLAEVVYIDSFGNAISGMRATLPSSTRLIVDGSEAIGHASTFGEVPPGNAFWYENANGLIEIAVNQARADKALSVSIGSNITVVS